jgi:hypothetical protein
MGEALLTIGYAKFIHVTIHSQISFHWKCKNIEENLFQTRDFDEFFCPVSHRMQIHFIFSDNVHILCCPCNVKKPRTTDKQTDQKQALF